MKSVQRPDDRQNDDTRKQRKSTRKVLLSGVFWRILIIEIILLVWSVGYRMVSEMPAADDLVWYTLRIILLIGIILLFMIITLSSFLKKRIIVPLEAITRANRHIDSENLMANKVDLPENTPAEIKDIADTRMQMLSDVLKESRERLRLINVIRETFGRYLSNKIVDEILESPEGQKIGGRRERVTILMSDLRGFTGLNEGRDPEETVQLLNRYLDRMSRIIMEYDGVIDEFLGDGILAIFGIPEKHSDDPARAVACSIAMQNALQELNAELQSEGLPQLEMGIGINTGAVIVGNIGSEIRMKYGIVGATVNTAARIESMTSGSQVLIGESTYHEVRDIVDVEPPETAMMKGLTQPLVCYPVRAIHAPRHLRLMVPLAKAEGVVMNLPFRCWVVRNKKVEEPMMDGETVRISHHNMVVRVPAGGSIEVHDNIKLQFQFCTDVHCFGDIYAKVVSITPEIPGSIQMALRVTAIRQEDRTILDHWTTTAS